jgi:predicted phage-related endonuclease
MMGHDQAWHDERRKGIGGSDATTIMTGDWLPLWEEKTGRRPPDDLSGVLPVQLGSFTESFNRKWFTKQTGIEVTTDDCEHLVHQEHACMRANLDGRVDGGIFEAKHTNAWAKEDEVVSKYYWQMQHCMAVSKAPLCYLSVIFGNMKWAFFEVKADAEAQAHLIEREAVFWRHVENDTPPGAQEAVVIDIALDDMREVDMAGSNAWAAHAGAWDENEAAAKAFKSADKELKALVEPDVKLAFGNGVKATRAKNGALTLRRMKQ